MKLTVFGASGDTGTHVISQALAGHEVVAVVREPARLRVPAHTNVDVTVAELMDTAAIADLVAGRDAVISALDPIRCPEETKIRTASVCSAGAHSITTTMRATGPRRLVVVSASARSPTGMGR
jgi:putative NADH-flavin reductase